MGDIKNAIKKLHTAAKSIKFDISSSLKDLTTGAPAHYLSLYHHLFLNYSPALANEILTKHQLELVNKSDKAFMEGVYKLLRDMFDYVPKLTQAQFFMTSYAQVKAVMAYDVISLIVKKVKALQPHPTTSNLASVESTKTSQPVSIAKTNQPIRSASLLIKKNSIKATTSIQNHLASKSSTSVVNKSPDHSHNETRSTTSLSSHDLNENQASKIQNLEAIISELNSKFQLVELKLEQLVKQNELLLQKAAQSPSSSVSNDTIQLSKSDYENLMSRMTILETDLLIRKNSKMSVETKCEDENETTFHSFLNSTNELNSSVIVNCANKEYAINTAGSDCISPAKTKNGFICQGLPIEFDKLNDSSLNSNDSTPTMNSVSKESKLIPKLDNTESSVHVLKAKDAVLRASLFCNDLIRINQQSKA